MSLKKYTCAVLGAVFFLLSCGCDRQYASKTPLPDRTFDAPAEPDLNFTGIPDLENTTGISSLNNKECMYQPFCYDAEHIYFANPRDDQFLYSYDGERLTRLAEMPVYGLNYCDNAVYFLSNGETVDPQDRTTVGGYLYRYLVRCFPYIKEAVTDEDGNICMLPILVEIPLITYNEKNCAENGIVLLPELEPFIQAVKQASTVSEYYDCARYWLVKMQLIGYLSDNQSFDTEEFRRFAMLLKEQCTEDIFKGNFELYSALMTAQGGMMDRYYASIYEKVLFTGLLYRFQQTALIKDENLRAAPMSVSGSGKSVAGCTFLCVNPYSDRLSETLDFIENTVSSMSSERNSCMLADPSTYESTPLARDLYSIYENGEICFQIPSEIYANDFEQYCADEITLDEFIDEADRKLSAYLNE